MCFSQWNRNSEPFRVDVTLANIPEGKAWVFFIDDDKLSDMKRTTGNDNLDLLLVSAFKDKFNQSSDDAKGDASSLVVDETTETVKWKILEGGLSVTLGTFPIKAVPFGETLQSHVSCLVDQKSHLKRKNEGASERERETKTVLAEFDTYLKKLTAEKDLLESRLMGKFISILNSKKGEIRSLSDELQRSQDENKRLKLTLQSTEAEGQASTSSRGKSTKVQVHEMSDTDEESDDKEDSECLLGTRKSSIDSQNFLDMSSSQELL